MREGVWGKAGNACPRRFWRAGEQIAVGNAALGSCAEQSAEVSVGTYRSEQGQSSIIQSSFSSTCRSPMSSSSLPLPIKALRRVITALCVRAFMLHLLSSSCGSD